MISTQTIRYMIRHDPSAASFHKPRTRTAHRPTVTGGWRSRMLTAFVLAAMAVGSLAQIRFPDRWLGVACVWPAMAVLIAREIADRRFAVAAGVVVWGLAFAFSYTPLPSWPLLWAGIWLTDQQKQLNQLTRPKRLGRLR